MGVTSYIEGKFIGTGVKIAAGDHVIVILPSLEGFVSISTARKNETNKRRRKRKNQERETEREIERGVGEKERSIYSIFH